MTSPDPSVGGPAAAGPRISWWDLPDPVRADVEAALGGSVTHARTQVGGFSPGAAARLTLDDGRRAFVKAVGAALNPDTPGLHRAEAEVLRRLPSEAPVPPLLHTYDDGDWVALVTEDVEGRQLSVPYLPRELDALRRALACCAELLTPSPYPDAPTFVASHHDLFDGWADLAAEPPTDLGGWPRDRLDRLTALERRAAVVCVGETLLHSDVRADNVLLRPDGRVVLVDWAWACRGPAWVDVVLLALGLATQGGPDPESLLAGDPLTAAVPKDDVDAFLAAAAGMWERNGRLPAPPGLPTLRPWQRHCAAATVRWLARRGL